MHIAINCRSIMLRNRTGIGKYTYNLLRCFGTMAPEHTFTTYAPKNLLDMKRDLPVFEFKNFRRKMDYFQSGVRGADIYHIPCPDDVCRFEGKLVVTIHDLVYKTFPQGHTQKTVDLTEGYMQQIVHKADKIICVSENTRSDVHKYFDISREKTTVVLNGVNHQEFRPLEDLSVTRPFLKSLGVDPGFIFFVGTLEPRKNLQGLLMAIAQLSDKGVNVPKLVVAGMHGWMKEQIPQLVRQLELKDKIIFTGFINNEQLNILYNTCGFFVFPSFYEGFGFPVLEAFSAGAASIVSKSSSCAEVAGDAAHLIDPSNPDDIARGITLLMEDKTLVKQLKKKALERAGHFSFEQNARQTLDIYRSLT